MEKVGEDDEGFTDQSNSQTVVTFEDHDDDTEYEMEDEKVLELFRRNSGLRPEVTERNNLMNKSEEMVLEFQEDTPVETQQTVFHSSAVNLNLPVILEGTKSSSASDEDTEDSSSNSDLDSNLSRYYFDGSLPVSAHVEESETHQDETKMPLLSRKQTVLQPTTWRNCCGLLELLRAADP